MRLLLSPSLAFRVRAKDNRGDSDRADNSPKHRRRPADQPIDIKLALPPAAVVLTLSECSLKSQSSGQFSPAAKSAADRLNTPAIRSEERRVGKEC